GVQHHGGDGDTAGVLGAAEHHARRGGDHAGGTGDGAGRGGEHGDRVHGECHGGDRDEPGERDARRYRDGGGLGGRGDVRQPVDRQGGHRLRFDLFPYTALFRSGVQHHGGDGDAAGVLRAAEHHARRGRDHAGGAG